MYEEALKEGRVYDVKLDGCFLTLSDEMMNIKNIKKIKLPIDEDIAILDIANIKPGTAVFNIKYITADTSRYLKDLKNIIDTYKQFTDFNLLFTKLDETDTYGNILNCKMYSGAELSYISTGQNVPDDISVIDIQHMVKKLLGGH